MTIENTKQNTNNNLVSRHPVVVVMGHIDHGKSSILDYIRKENITGKEAGGITQHIGAYEAEVKCGEEHEHKTTKITFLDTPGHEAFSQMRMRGANVADVAVLVVAADDGPKPQTVEAFESIQKAGIPIVIAFNKIDKPEAEVERVKAQLAEKQIFVEGYGGDIATVKVSAKTGEGMDELLDIILLLSEMENLKGNPNENASGLVIESHIDAKRGISATLLIKNGSLKKGMFVVAGSAIAPVRIFENFNGKSVDEASFSSPVKIIGFSAVPETGSSFCAFSVKPEAEKYATDVGLMMEKAIGAIKKSGKEGVVVITILIKSDVSGSLEALEKELKKLENEEVFLNILKGGVGKISENDIKTISGAEKPMVFGFNIGIEDSARIFAERFGVEIFTSDIIYKISERLEHEINERKALNPKEELVGIVKVIKNFSATKTKKVVGANVVSGKALDGRSVVIKREREEIVKKTKPLEVVEEGGPTEEVVEEVEIIKEEIGRGKIIGLKKQKEEVKEIKEGEDFGMQLETPVDVQVGDIVEIIKRKD